MTSLERLQHKWPELDFSESKWKGYKSSITYICKIHGKQSTTPHELSRQTRKGGCGLCNMRKANLGDKNPMYRTAEQHKLDFTRIHKTQYIYNKTDFNKSSKESNVVTCRKHGDFIITIGNHKQGRGCPECAKVKNRENTLGWQYTRWENFGNKSKNFKGFKLYEIECTSDTETFYKVGKTYVNINKRFGKSKFPYTYKVLNIVEGDANYISKLEEYYKKSMKEHKYIPLKSFGGMHECFSKPINIKKLKF